MNKVGIYIHWPFCKARCPYCDFNVQVTKSPIDYQLWLNTYKKSINFYADKTNYTHIKSIFFGGGTPSLMPPWVVADILDYLQIKYQFTDDIEVTLEANPTSTEQQNLQGYRNAGVNRISLGVQSLNPEYLKFLGRGHTVEEAIETIYKAREIYDRVSFDIISARPGQTVDSWAAELKRIVQLEPDHISIYQLTIEPGTPFDIQRQKGDLAPLDNDAQASIYECTVDTFEQNGLYQYEISNFARKGEESIHKLVYWQYEDFIGIGPGAHGRVTIGDGRCATYETKSPGRWIEQQNEFIDPISPKDQQLEQVMMNLRLSNGMKIPSFIDEQKIQRFAKDGFLWVEGEIFGCTKRGLQRLNSVLEYLL